MSSKRNVEVYLSKGAGELEGAIDFEHIQKVAAKMPGVSAVRDADDAVISTLTSSLENGSSDRAVLAGFADPRLAQKMAALLECKGKGETLFAFASFAWPRSIASDKEAATKLAEASLLQAVARVNATDGGELVERGACKDVLVIGEGPAAMSAALEAHKDGLPVTLVTSEADLGRTTMAGIFSETEATTLDKLRAALTGAKDVEVLTGTTLLTCARQGNGFVAWLQGDGDKTQRSFGAVVAAPEPTLVPRFEQYGLTKRGDGVISQSACETLLHDEAKLAAALPPGKVKTVVFLVGLGNEAQVVSSARSLRAALEISSREGVEVRLVTRNLKVAGQGLEELSQLCRSQGVVIFKVNDNKIPAIEAKESKTSIRCMSPVMNEEVELLADILVVDEDLLPSPLATTLIDGLRLEPGPGGLLQPDNVHMTPLGTSHQGLLAVGPARGVFDLEGGLIDGMAAAAELRGLLTDGPVWRIKTEVDEGKCVACLTCYRLCPHDAITFEDYPRFSPLFCMGCGICSGACPQNAITVTGYPDARIEAEIQAAAEAPKPSGAPAILALCCKRSAFEALKLAWHRGLELPINVRALELPCAGRVDEEHILTGLVAGFDGVMVLGCHDDNCRSIRGNMHARNRVTWLKDRLKSAGLSPDRLWFGTVASNMSAEVAQQCRDFEAKLVELDAPPVEESKSEVAEAQA
jgi:heterodisulfide reductase subunit A-like polyferredoxin/coenzyme F420-reducing hydrogenase delta subunit